MSLPGASGLWKGSQMKEIVEIGHLGHLLVIEVIDFGTPLYWLLPPRLWDAGDVGKVELVMSE